MKKLIKKMFIPLVIVVTVVFITLIPMERNYQISNIDSIAEDDGNSREGVYILSVRNHPSER